MAGGSMETRRRLVAEPMADADRTDL